MWERDLPLDGGWAGGVAELLNKATLALNLEPGSAGTGHGEVASACHGEEDVSAISLPISLPPKWENTAWEEAKNQKAIAHRHSHEFLQPERETQAQQDTGALGFVLEKKATRPPAVNLDCTEEQPAFAE